MISSQEPAFDIERILEETVIDNKPHYLVKWKGYEATESTWEPIDNLLKVLDILHEFKQKRNPHSRILIEDSEETQQKSKKKTKKIGNKEHVVKDNQRQKKLNQARKQTQMKNKKHRKNHEIESVSLLSSDDQQMIEEPDTHQTQQIRKSQRISIRKQTNSQNIDRKQKKKKKVKSNEDQKIEAEQIEGFKVVGKITKDGISKITCCFQWENQKVCEVELRDGRKVNMRREDIKKICPDKLCEYFQKLQGL